jgi:hypothetical protein
MTPRKVANAISFVTKMSNHTRRCPTEILANILEECSAFPLRATSGEGVYLLNGPWSLRMVCRRWKAITDSNSRLWSRIIICPGRGKSTNGPSKKGGSPVRLALKRGMQLSKDAPLYVQFNLGYHDSSLTGSGPNPLFIIIMTESHRIVDLNLTITRDVYEPLSSLMDSFGALRNLTLDAYGMWNKWGNHNPDPEPLRSFASCPHLKTLQMKGNEIIRLNIDFPWRNITSFKFSDIGHQLRALLGKLSAISELDLLHVHVHYDEHRDWDLPSTLLFLRLPLSTQTPFLLRRSVLPNLEELHMEQSHGRPKDATVESEYRPEIVSTLKIVLDLCDRSGCSLKVLHLKISYIHESVLQFVQSTALQELEVLHLTPQFHSCSPEDAKILCDLLKTLKNPSDSSDPPFLPRLTSLTIHHNTADGVCPCWGGQFKALHRCVGWIGPDFFDMVESRLTSSHEQSHEVAKLQRVKVQFDFSAHLPFVTSEEEERMKRWLNIHRCFCSVRTRASISALKVLRPTKYDQVAEFQ